MVVNQKPTGRASSMPIGLLIGVAVSMGITIVSAALLARLVESEKMKEAWIGYGIMVILWTASFVGALSAHARIKRQRLLVCILSGLAYFSALLCITALFFGGQYEAVGVTAILVMGGAVVAALTGGNKSRGGKHRKIRRSNC